MQRGSLAKRIRRLRGRIESREKHIPILGRESRPFIVDDDRPRPFIGDARHEGGLIHTEQHEGQRLAKPLE